MPLYRKDASTKSIFFDELSADNGDSVPSSAGKVVLIVDDDNHYRYNELKMTVLHSLLEGWELSIHNHLLLWNHAALKVVDVRRRNLQPGESLVENRLPASAFFCVIQGRGHLLIDERPYQVQPYQICHAGRGMSLQLFMAKDACEYYMVLYKATLPTPCREELLRLQQSSNPFQLPCSLEPRHPLPLFGYIEQMHRQWLTNGQLERFHAKALFHQFVFEWLQQLQQGDDPSHQSLVDRAVRLIEDRYAEKMSLNMLADMLGISTRQLQRLFKTGLQMGPMEYVLQVRLEKAKDLLGKRDVPLAQIAEAVGFADSYYFSRIFKKYTGISPGQFKAQAQARTFEERRQNPSELSQSFIVAQKAPMYSVTDENGSHYQRDDASASNSRAVQPAQSGGYARHVNPEGGVAGASRTYIRHLKGRLQLEPLPKRIAVLDYQYIDQLLALGHLPIGSVFGMRGMAKLPVALAEKMDGIKRLGTKDAPDLAAIAEASPDLIICTEIQTGIYHELVKIAPTVMLARNDDWRLTLPVLGRMLGKEREAQKIIDEYNQKVIHVKDALAAKMGGKTVSLIRPRDNMIRLHTTAHRTAKILYRDLGIAPPSMAVDSKKTSSFIGLDAMPELNADHLFVLMDDSNEELTNEYQKSAIWKGLHVVKANQVRMFNTTTWIGYYGPIAINRVVDEIAEALL